MASSTLCAAVGELAMTSSTAAVAVCCSSACVTLRLVSCCSRASSRYHAARTRFRMAAPYRDAAGPARQTLLALDKAEIARFCQRHHIRRLALFGSVLRDDFRADSDVDVLVEFEPGHAVGLIRLAGME